MQGGTPLHIGYPMCNSHLKTRKENSYATILGAIGQKLAAHSTREFAKMTQAM